jgi:hypothetical protein
VLKLRFLEAPKIVSLLLPFFLESHKKNIKKISNEEVVSVLWIEPIFQKCLKLLALLAYNKETLVLLAKKKGKRKSWMVKAWMQ